MRVNAGKGTGSLGREGFVHEVVSEWGRLGADGLDDGKGLDPVQLWREVDAQEPESRILFTGGEGVDVGSGMSSLAIGMHGHEVAF